MFNHIIFGIYAAVAVVSAAIVLIGSVFMIGGAL